MHTCWHLSCTNYIYIHEHPWYKSNICRQYSSCSFWSARSWLPFTIRTQKHKKITPPNIWVITPKHEGFTWFPMVCKKSTEKNDDVFFLEPRSVPFLMDLMSWPLGPCNKQRWMEWQWVRRIPCRVRSCLESLKGLDGSTKKIILRGIMFQYSNGGIRGILVFSVFFCHCVLKVFMICVAIIVGQKYEYVGSVQQNHSPFDGHFWMVSITTHIWHWNSFRHVETKIVLLGKHIPSLGWWI